MFQAHGQHTASCLGTSTWNIRKQASVEAREPDGCNKYQSGESKKVTQENEKGAWLKNGQRETFWRQGLGHLGTALLRLRSCCHLCISTAINKNNKMIFFFS